MPPNELKPKPKPVSFPNTRVDKKREGGEEKNKKEKKTEEEEEEVLPLQVPSRQVCFLHLFSVLLFSVSSPFFFFIFFFLQSNRI